MDYMAGSLLPFKRVQVGVRPCGGYFDAIDNADYLLPKSTAQNQSRWRRRSPCGPASGGTNVGKRTLLYEISLQFVAAHLRHSFYLFCCKP